MIVYLAEGGYARSAHLRLSCDRLRRTKFSIRRRRAKTSMEHYDAGFPIGSYSKTWAVLRGGGRRPLCEYCGSHRHG